MSVEHVTEHVSEQNTPSISDTFGKLPNLVNKEAIIKTINLQGEAISRLENTNKALYDCNNQAQAKLNSITKLFKNTMQQMKDSKRDLDVIHRKLHDMKSKIKLEKSNAQPSE